MKRRIMTIIVFLLLGAIANVAVAWSLLYVPQRLSYRLWGAEVWILDEAEEWDLALLRQAFGNAQEAEIGDCLVTGSRRVGWTLKQIECRLSWEKFPDDLTFYRVDRLTCGWPVRSMAVARVWSSRDTEESGIIVDAITGPKDALPKQPLWLGFVLNTFFYAALFWLFFIATTARRTLRRRRGLCAKCAYPIGVSPVCTECSAPVPRKLEA